MAIRAHAGQVALTLWNGGRESANPPVVFPGVNASQAFSYSFWVAPLNNIPLTMLYHWGTDGSYFGMGHDGNNWFISCRSGSVGLPTQYFAPVQVGRWTLICVTKETNNFNIFVGVEDPTIPNPWTVPVQVVNTMTYSPDLAFELQFFSLFTTPNSPICNFKFWHTTLTIPEINLQAQRWDTGGGPIPPFWASPLRTAGDVSSIANPYASTNWAHGHAYSEINIASNLESYMNDPQYMANANPCITWVYPNEFANIYIDPGLTPVVPTFYKAPQFYDFADKGSVPTLDFQVSSIMYYGSSFGGVDPGTPFTECWGLYKDENGVEVSNTTDTQYRLNPGTTGVAIPGPIKASTMYLWKFGGQFKWLPVTPQGPTNMAHMGYLLLLVTYQGYPSGVPALPAVDLAGLFAINKGGPSVDEYNRGVIKKIPDPTIKTAYIGE